MAGRGPNGIRYGRNGTLALGKPADGTRGRDVVTEQSLEPASNPAHEDLRRALVVAHGTDIGVHNVT